MIELSCTVEEKIKVTVNPVTPGGVPATLDGPIQASVQSGNGTVALVDEDSFFVISGDLPGDTTFLVSGDADLGAGVQTISDTVLLHAVEAKASNLGLTSELPVLK